MHSHFQTLYLFHDNSLFLPLKLKVPFVNLQSLLIKIEHFFIFSNNLTILLSYLTLNLLFYLYCVIFTIISNGNFIITLIKVFCFPKMPNRILYILFIVVALLRFQSFESLFESLHLFSQFKQLIVTLRLNVYYLKAIPQIFVINTC